MADLLLVSLDLGCGRHKRDGYIGVDIAPLPGVDVVCDLRKTPWPWEDDSVDHIYTHHTLEHFYPVDFVKVMNECYRILKPGAEMEIIVPLYPSDSAMADFDHKMYFTTETFGRFERENEFAYEVGVINKWKRLLNDWTPAVKLEERSDGYAIVFPRLRELHVILKKT
jgi:SAM-dependent methyltransferase